MSSALIDKTLFSLHEVEQHTRSSEELEALRIAKIALHFIQSLGESYGFEDYLLNFNSDAPPRPLLSFASRSLERVFSLVGRAPPTARHHPLMAVRLLACPHPIRVEVRARRERVRLQQACPRMRKP